MKKSHLLILLSSLVFTLGFADDSKKVEKVIYKWERGGLIHYSHIKPEGVSGVIKLDSNGRKIEDYTENFGEVVQIVVRPPKKETKSEEEAQEASAAENQEKQKKITIVKAKDKQKADSQEQKLRKENCQTARKNLETINTGEVYERDPKGNLVRMSDKQLETKRKDAQRDIDYFCK